MFEKHYRRCDVEDLTGLSRSTIYALMAAGEFPRPVRNLFRSRPHCFMGVWRREWAHGEHLHLLIHAPRKMRATPTERLPVWLDDPIDPATTSKTFNRRVWQVACMGKTWHLCRLHAVAGALDYISKVPVGPNGEALAVDRRLRGIPKGAREYGIIGVRHHAMETMTSQTIS